jgi:hypothetical protein
VPLKKKKEEEEEEEEKKKKNKKKKKMSAFGKMDTQRVKQTLLLPTSAPFVLIPCHWVIRRGTVVEMWT